jgi:NTE family protein
MSTDDKTQRMLQNIWISQCILFYGLPGFFKPRMMNPWFLFNSTPDKLSFYDTDELRDTLSKIINFDILNEGKTRITLGAVCVETGDSIDFDNTRMEIKLDHVMASCALPPGFPAVRIGDKTFWDGGVSSNTPISIILKEKLPHKILCFMINLFQHQEEDPTNMLEVLKRRRDIEYSSRHHEVLRYFHEKHRLELALFKLKEEEEKNHPNETLDKALKNEYPSALNIIRFHYRDEPFEILTKDFVFSRDAIRDHYEAGYRDFQKALTNREWFNVIDDYTVILNELN